MGVNTVRKFYLNSRLLLAKKTINTVDLHEILVDLNPSKLKIYLA